MITPANTLLHVACCVKVVSLRKPTLPREKLGGSILLLFSLSNAWSVDRFVETERSSFFSCVTVRYRCVTLTL